jgi:hypothetical protein
MQEISPEALRYIESYLLKPEELTPQEIEEVEDWVATPHRGLDGPLAFRDIEIIYAREQTIIK